jgi:hypothetical protein
VAERVAIGDLIGPLIAPPSGTTTPAFQSLIGTHLTPILNRLKAESLAIETVRQIRQQVTVIRDEVAVNRPGELFQQRAGLFGALLGSGVVPRDVPPANALRSSTTATHGTYTVGATRQAWISARGAAAGQDVMSWTPTADINYAYNLISASYKLVGAHLIPAMLGGRADNANLTPAVNVVNGWLAANPERYAKTLVFSEGACIQYDVACQFQRRAHNQHHRMATTVESLVPSGITVTITRLTHQGGDPRDWATYTPDTSTTRSFPVPIDPLSYTPV